MLFVRTNSKRSRRLFNVPKEKASHLFDSHKKKKRRKTVALEKT